MKMLTLRRSGVCAGCQVELSSGTRAGWDSSTRTVHCEACLAGAQNGTRTDTEPPHVPAARRPEEPRPADIAGASAQRQYEKLSARHEQQVRKRHPWIGGLLLALNDEPTRVRVWAQGAAGERAVGKALEALDQDESHVLHDRRMRREDGRLSKANIDHLVVVPGGVWVVDAKTHTGKLEVRYSGGLFSPRTAKLLIAGRDQTKLLTGLTRQIEAVKTGLGARFPEVPVRGALCFIGTDLPWFATEVDGIPLVGPRGLRKHLRRPGPLDPQTRAGVADFLHTHFPPAH